MSQSEIEIELKRLKKEVSLLKSKVSKIEKTNGSKEPWWQQIAGTFANDPIYDEAMRLGREYRLAQREDYDKGVEDEDGE